ncbi:HPF/RaiA family ribosome-associated protein [Kribbella speibonae]|uniref:Ribosome-associated translation inhibitor RaiA n=1 Tax=Kribbella speibonae TaxID=1572660 RepID=A0A4R0IC96_9ACTN|nr:HPF/RaiA family ribosome-associated protein [Kribbella speibonae]TCC30761.1 hypothetical protein E0H92_37225 [Kribbella speibonae]
MNTPVQLTVRGQVPEPDAKYAAGKVTQALNRLSTRVQHVHVVVSLGTNPANERPAAVEVEVVLDGSPLHVHATAATPAEAVDEAADRLRRQLSDVHDRSRSQRRIGAPRITVPVESEEDGDD